jgi:hypothetical protein
MSVFEKKDIPRYQWKDSAYLAALESTAALKCRTGFHTLQVKGAIKKRPIGAAAFSSNIGRDVCI